jgi:ribonuclease HI
MPDTQKPQLRIYVDGSSRGNPGPSGVGIAIFAPGKDEPIEQISKYIGITTNNVAEYEAVIHALKWMGQSGSKSAELLLDSELVYKQVKGKYRVRSPHIALLVKRIRMLESGLNTTMTLVPRDENKLANRLAQKASQRVKINRKSFKQPPLHK